MRKIVLAVAAAASALAVAAPATAQFYPQPAYGYNGYGYNNWGPARGLHMRIRNVLRSLDGVRWGQREELRNEAIQLDQQLRYASLNGLNPREAQRFDYRIAQLERRLQWASNNRYGRYGNGYYGHGGYDRDRDGRDDRYEDDHGWDHDDR